MLTPFKSTQYACGLFPYFIRRKFPITNGNRNSLKRGNFLFFYFVRYPNYICQSNFALTRIKFLSMKKSIFYHAGCPVCVSAENDIIHLIGEDNIEVVHLGENKIRIDEAERYGVNSVPALVTPNGNVLHLNFGASIADVKG